MKKSNDVILNENVAVSSLQDISYRHIEWSANEKFHDQTRLAVRLHKSSWYLLAEGMHLSMKNERYKEQAESLDAYWKARGIPSDTLKKHLERYLWLLNNDDLKINHDPPSYRVMGLILDCGDTFVHDKDLRTLILSGTYTRHQAEDIVRAKIPNVSVNLHFNAERSTISLTRSMDRINEHYGLMEKSLRDDLYKFTQSEKVQIVRGLEDVLRLLSPKNQGEEKGHD